MTSDDAGSRTDRRLREVLLLLTFLCALLPAAVIVLLVDVELNHAATTQVVAITGQAASRIGSMVLGLEQELKTASVFFSFHGHSRDDTRAYLSAVRLSSRNLRQVTLLNQAGDIVATSSSSVPITSLPEPTTTPTFFRVAGDPWVSLSVPLDHSLDGSLVGVVRLTSIVSQLRRAARSASGHAYLYDAQGHLLASDDGKPPAASLLHWKKDAGGQRIVVNAPVEGTHWSVVTTRSATGIFSVPHLFLFAIGFTLFALAMAFLATILFKRFWMGPAQRRLEGLGANSLALQDKVEQKDLLLRETHHRIKNDLQIVTSMLNLSDSDDLDAADHAVLVESQNRVRTISLIHELLHRSTNLAGISIQRYLLELIRRIEGSLVRNSEGVSIVPEVGDYYFDPDTSVTCGLLLNELLTNSLKHAFPNDGDGVIRVLFERIRPDRFLLRVEDDGIGLPAGCSIRQSKSLGIRLIRALTEQLDGTLSIDSDRGTSWCIQFDAKEVAAPAAL